MDREASMASSLLDPSANVLVDIGSRAAFALMPAVLVCHSAFFLGHHISLRFAFDNSLWVSYTKS